MLTNLSIECLRKYYPKLPMKVLHLEAIRHHHPKISDPIEDVNGAGSAKSTLQLLVPIRPSHISEFISPIFIYLDSILVDENLMIKHEASL